MLTSTAPVFRDSAHGTKDGVRIIRRGDCPCQCRADKLGGMDERTLQVIVLRYLTTVLQLALAALDLVDAPEDTTLRHLQALEDMRQELELGTVALLQVSGVTWEAMATQVGVARQSLHRRVAKRAMNYLYLPKRLGNLKVEWQIALDGLQGTIQELACAGADGKSLELTRILLARRDGHVGQGRIP